MKRTFTVWIDGCYYYDDEEYDVEIDLTDKEMATIKKLVSEYDDDLDRGLIPILEAGNKEIYQKFYDVIYPDVFLTLFLRDDMFEPNPEDEGRKWAIKDFEYLKETYGEQGDYDEMYICRIPEDMMP